MGYGTRQPTTHPLARNPGQPLLPAVGQVVKAKDYQRRFEAVTMAMAQATEELSLVEMTLAVENAAKIADMHAGVGNIVQGMRQVTRRGAVCQGDDVLRPP